MQTIVLNIIVVIVVLHLMMAAVMALYSRYKIQYLALAWIMGLFAVFSCISLPFTPLFNFERVGYLHPFMLLLLVVLSFLQGIYPLSITMPGYLQWGRMVKYASPAIFLIILYIVCLLAGSHPIIIHSYSELLDNWWRPDMLFRLAGLFLSLYYVANILRLPREQARSVEIPRYVKGYTTVLGMNMLFYVVVIAVFDPVLIMVFFIMFCVLNMYLFFRTLETMAQRLPKPMIVEVEKEPVMAEEEKEEDEDFNEANRSRFERMEYFMQHQRDWEDSTFSRDRLCEATGINRHLMLQCLRSQGYNNCHDYINSYRIRALKHGIADGSIASVNDAVVVGFGSVKTARSCFERMEGMRLDDYLKRKLERKG